MLNIRMSRTPIEGSPVPGCLTPRRAHILMWSRFVPGTIFGIRHTGSRATSDTVTDSYAMSRYRDRRSKS